ncbi:hypothetical protein BGI40_04360 [Snodgrassella communis]|uniref:recombination protein NinG n=1 Tax=Snodgrassella communis TaxID=2946699 RepID=UPI00056D8B81|nr:hypothetical protein BGI40_04360 [Snodgrassella communis]
MKQSRKLPKRKCHLCGSEFEKLRPLQIVCSPACAIALNKQNREAANKKHKRQQSGENAQ